MTTRLPSRTLLAAARRVAVITATSVVALFGILGLYETDALAAPSLPGGASSLQETYQDWHVSCISQEAGPYCSLIQQQINRETGQPLLAVELTTTESGGLSGTVALPLGLRLDAGVTFQVDDGRASPPLPFSTCLPGGCLVPIAPDEIVSAELREGETLRLAARLLDGRTINFSVSLNGFAAAHDRLQALEANL